MKLITKILLLALAAALIISPVTASTEKEEVVYVNLENNGVVEDVYVVNIFELRNPGTITDYGNYNSVKNLMTTDTINVNGDMITVDTCSGKFYYEGDFGKAEIPWDIKIRYFINGVEILPDKMGGQSGALEIRFSISENPNVDEIFYKNFALIMTVNLDANKCMNIISNGATVSNVGSDKQLSYTVMPDKGLETSIYTNVIDFEIGAITINGVGLSMDFDVDTSEIEDDFNDLEQAIIDLDDGVLKIKEGTSSLMFGAASVESGASSLASGLNTFSDKVKPANEVIMNIARDVESLVNRTGNTTLIEYYNMLLENITAFTDAVPSAAAGASQLSNGAGKLTLGTQSLYAGVSDLYEGTNELRNETTGMTDKFNDKLDEILDPLRGIGDTTKSYVSSKNTDVNMVQFVMHTEAIEKPEEPVPEPEPEPELNFFERLLKLFGLN